MAIPIINVSILNGSNGFRLDGTDEFDRSGTSVSNAGDVNGDGFGDVIVGAPNTDSNGDLSGSSYVVFGKAAGFDAVMDLSSLDGSNGFRVDGEEGDHLGRSVSGAGDVNGDGLDDVVIGARYADSNGDKSGSSYVVFGKVAGFDAVMDLSSLDGTSGFSLAGAEVFDRFGSVVSGAGDVNGDGFEDVIIDSGSGASYVVFGKAAGFDAVMDLSSLDGSNGFRLGGSIYSVSNAGDVNGDGFDDVIVGNSNYYDYFGSYYGGSFDGITYVVFGKASGFGATLDLSKLDGSNGFRMTGGIHINSYMGRSVSAAGDINGDGFDDAITSGNSYSRIMFGKASGFEEGLDIYRLNVPVVSAAGDINGDGFDDLIMEKSDSVLVAFGKTLGWDDGDMPNFDGTDGFRLEGLSLSGSDVVSSAGDVNGDGFDDLLIGSSDADPDGKSGAGASYVLFGGSFINEAIYLGTPGNDNLVGTEMAERFEAGGGNDRMTGLGGADVFNGGGGDDTIVVSDLGFQRVDGGTGNDTLVLADNSINPNLADLRDTVDGIETIDLATATRLTITLPDLLGLSDTTNIFTVNGSQGSRVFGLVDGWEDRGIDGDYHIFTNQGTILRIDTDMRTDRSPLDVINLGDLDGSIGFRLDGSAFGGGFGPLVSNAGDINGDGLADMIVDVGLGAVVFGKAAGVDAIFDLSNLDGSNGFQLTGGFGKTSFNSAGDINGDGFDDVISGSSNAYGLNGHAGSSYVVFGRASGFGAALDVSNLDGSNGFRIDGAAMDDMLGMHVSDAGDVNGDGFDDLIVSAPGTYWGSNYVVFGKASGFDVVLDLSNLDGSNGFRIDGRGSSVSNAGDINGDGLDDVIIGATLPDWISDYDSSYVVFGKTSGFDAAINLSSLNGRDGFRLVGESAFDKSGFSVSSAGDVNGDGFDDVIIGASDAHSNGSFSGSSYVVFGKASGFRASINLSNLYGTNGFRLDGADEDDESGHSVSGAGDVNGDGFDDVIIGAPNADPGGTGSGSSYVVFGRASGFDAAMNLSSLDGSNGFRLDGAAKYDGSGSSVSGAGDVNGDGFDDLIVGIRGLSYSSYVIFGRSDFSGGQLPTIPGTPGDDVLRGTSVAEILEAGDGNDLLIGRGGRDVFHGGAGVDQIKVTDLNFASIDGGSGNDILHLDGKDLNLDLTAIGDKIHGIETICLYGRGDNTLTLTADSMLNLSDTSNTLKLHGNAGDRVTVQNNGWIDGGVKGFYHTYTNDDAVLLVGANLAIEFI